MTFKNTSRYPKEEVRRLIAFALRNIDHREVAVHVKNRRNAVSGRAYRTIPWLSPFRRNPKLRYLITVSIGAASTFPFTARYVRRKSDKGWPLVEHRDWREGLVGVAAHEAQHIKQFQFKMPISEQEAERVEFKRIAEYRR